MAGYREARNGGAAARVARVLLGVAPWAGLAAMAALWSRARTSPAEPAALPEPEHLSLTEPGRGRAAPSPAAIPARGWRDIVWRTWLEVGRDRLPAVAGGITFYSLLAIFPAIGAFVSLYGLFGDVNAVSRHLKDLAAFVPGPVLSLLGEQMVRLTVEKHASLSLAFAGSLLLSVWSANAGMQSLIDGLNIAYGETEKRRFLVRRGMIYAFTFAAIVFLTLVTGILVALPLVIGALGLWDWWVIPARWLAVLGLATLAFAVVYRFGPSRQPARWRWVRWGAMAAALAWLGGSLGYSWFLNHVANYDATYGSLGAVVGFMMWIWVSAMVVLIGAELNAEIEHQTATDSTAGPSRPLGQRGAVVADSVGPGFQGLHGLWAGAAQKLRRGSPS